MHVELQILAQSYPATCPAGFLCMERDIQNINDMLSILEHFSLHVAPEGSDGPSTINSEAL